MIPSNGSSSVAAIRMSTLIWWEPIVVLHHSSSSTSVDSHYLVFCSGVLWWGRMLMLRRGTNSQGHSVWTPGCHQKYFGDGYSFFPPLLLFLGVFLSSVADGMLCITVAALQYTGTEVFLRAIRANRTPQTTGGGRYLKWTEMWQSANGCSTESKHSMLCSSTLIKILHGPMMVTADPLRWTHSRLLNFYW